MSKTRRARDTIEANMPQSKEAKYPWRRTKRSRGPNFKRVRRYQ